MNIIVEILESFLGQPKTHYENKSQVGFDCPMCAEDKGLPHGDKKGNLAIQYEKGVYKCWSCWERNNMHGSIYKLIKRYGTSDNLRDYLLVAPKYVYKKDEDWEPAETLSLPEGFKYLSESTKYDTGYTDAVKYLKGRRITQKIIEKYNIGFTADGRFKNRIIIPSYNEDGEVNYFIARAWAKWAKPKYLNPDAEKEKVIFNEHKINWDSTIYLVEGVFDHIVVPNSIPLLGKFVSTLLLYMLITKAKSDIVIVLDGGEEEKLDAEFLYKRLNTLNLYDRIKIVTLTDGWDLSKLHEERGKEAIVGALRTAYQIKESAL